MKQNNRKETEAKQSTTVTYIVSVSCAHTGEVYKQVGNNGHSAIMRLENDDRCINVSLKVAEEEE